MKGKELSNLQGPRTMQGSLVRWEEGGSLQTPGSRGGEETRESLVLIKVPLSNLFKKGGSFEQKKAEGQVSVCEETISASSRKKVTLPTKFGMRRKGFVKKKGRGKGERYVP